MIIDIDEYHEAQKVFRTRMVEYQIKILTKLYGYQNFVSASYEARKARKESELLRPHQQEERVKLLRRAKDFERFAMYLAQKEQQT